MLKHVSSFVDQGGILITTASSASSLLSEICRRLLRIRISETINGFESRVRFASSIFDVHLKTLGTSTRPTDDWVIDVIFHDWQHGKYVFTLMETADALADGFDFYQSLPSFITDDRWYKKASRGIQSPGEMLARQYPILAGCLIDYRIPLSAVLRIERDLGFIETLSKSACDVHDAMLDDNSYRKLDEFLRIMIELRNSLPIDFAQTIASIDDYVTSLPKFIDRPDAATFGEFKNWWGRGQQYASFVRSA